MFYLALESWYSSSDSSSLSLPLIAFNSISTTAGTSASIVCLYIDLWMLITAPNVALGLQQEKSGKLYILHAVAVCFLSSVQHYLVGLSARQFIV